MIHFSSRTFIGILNLLLYWTSPRPLRGTLDARRHLAHSAEVQLAFNFVTPKRKKSSGAQGTKGAHLQLTIIFWFLSDLSKKLTSVCLKARNCQLLGFVDTNKTLMITEKHKVLTHSQPSLIIKTILAWDQALSGLSELRGFEGEGGKESLHSRLINLNADLPPRMGWKMLIGWFVNSRWRNAPRERACSPSFFVPPKECPGKLARLRKQS